MSHAELSELQEKAERRQRLNRIVFPAFRATGGLMLCLLATLQWYLLPQISVNLQAIWTGVLGYVVAAWALAYWFHQSEEAAQRTALLIFNLDVLVFTFVIYLTGGPASYLFPILMVRVADQINFNRLRVLWFSHVTSLSYIFMLYYLQMEGATFAWGPEVMKVGLLYICGLYLALTADTGQRLRRKLVRAVQAANRATERLAVRNQELEAARGEAASALRTRERFFQNVSHELRTPLNSILGFCDLTRDDINPVKKQKFLDRIQEGGERLLCLVDRIIQVTGIEHERPPLELEPTLLPEFLQPLIEEAQATALSKGVKLDFAFECVPPLQIDRDKVAELVGHLLANAYRNCGESGVVRVSLRKTENGVNLEFRDSGAYDDGLENPSIDSGGLQLAVAMSLVQLHGGKLAAKGESGKSGRSVIVSLPMAG